MKVVFLGGRRDTSTLWVDIFRDVLARRGDGDPDRPYKTDDRVDKEDGPVEGTTSKL